VRSGGSGVPRAIGANARTDTIGRANLDGTGAIVAASAEELLAEATAVRDSLGCGTS